jgi:hypothetical protein
MAANPQVQIEELNARAVRDLVRAHAERTEEPLVLAVRYGAEDRDVYLLEVLDGFPGGDDDAPFVTEFGPSAELLILGKLHLTLLSPAQLRSAIGRGDALLAKVRGGTVAYRADGDRARVATEFVDALQLRA